MNIWQNAVLTNKGLALQAKLIAGTTLNITRAVTGSGYVTPGLLQQQTAVTGIKQTMNFRPITYPESGKCCVPAYLTNDGLATGYTAMQVGLYATDPDEGEILYFIAQAASGTGTVIPSATEMPGFNAEWNLYFQYGQADTVNVTVDPSNTVSFSALENELAERGLTITAVTTANSDLNTYTDRGIYTFAAAYAPTNAPTGNTNGWLIVIPWTEGSTVNTIKQIWLRHGVLNSSDHEIYVRTKFSSGSTWSTWAEIITDKDIDSYTDPIEAALTAHIGNTSNPHNVTRAQVGLGITSVDSVTDLDTYTSRGIYTFAQAYAPTNAPAGNTNGWLIVLPWNETESVQTIKQIWLRHGAINTSDHECYVRTKVASQGSWSTWAQLYTSKDISLGNNGITYVSSGGTQVFIPKDTVLDATTES